MGDPTTTRRGFLSSPRRRRRIAWIGTLAAVAGGLVAVALVLRGPGRVDAPITGKGWAPKPAPAKVARGREDLRAPLAVVDSFLRTAVDRKHVARSWDIVSPALRSGYTRETWAKGEIPVVPFPVDAVRYKLDYSFPNEIGFKVALFPRRGAEVPATVFDIDLVKVGKGAGRHWVVDNFNPGPVKGPSLGGGPGTALPNLGDGVYDGGRHLSAAWLAVPFALLALIVVAPLTFFVLAHMRNRRAEREWLRSSGRAV